MTLPNSESATSTRNESKEEPPAVEANSIVQRTPTRTNDMETQREVQDEAAKTAEPEHVYLTGVKLYLITFALILAVFTMALEAGIIGVAIPQITSHFHSIEDVGWYGAAFLIVNCSFIPFAGNLYKHCSLRWTFLFFLAFFSFGAVITGAAQSSSMLIGGRVIQGLGGSGIFTGGVSIITASASEKQRPMMFGLIVSMASIGMVVGPLIGGALIEGASWRWCFFIELPLAAVSAILVAFIAFPTRPQAKLTFLETLKHLDFVGLALFAPAIIQLLLALEWGRTKYAWDSATIIGLFIGGPLTMVVFVYWEAREGENAMIPLSMVKKRVVACACGTGFFQMGGLMMLTFYLPIWFQGVKNASPVGSGVMTLPMALSQIFYAVATGWFVGKFGYYTPCAIIGSLLCAIGTGLFSTFTPHTGAGPWIGYQILAGAGRGMVMQMLIMAVQNVLPKSQTDAGSSFLIFVQFLGGAIFVALGQTVFANRLIAEMQVYAPTINSEIIVNTGITSIRSGLPADQVGNVILAYNDALAQTYYLASGGAALAFFISFGLGWGKSVKEDKKEKLNDEEKGQVEEAVAKETRAGKE